MSARTGDTTKTTVTNIMAVSLKSMLGDAGRQQSPASGISGSNVRCGMHAASQLHGGELTYMDDAPAPTS